MLLNQDAPHHTHLRKIVSRAFTPRAIESLREELRLRARNIAKRAAAEGSGDFVEQVSCELPLQAIAGLMGVPQEDRNEAVRLVEPDGRRPGPGVRQERSDGRIGRTDHVRHADGRRARQEPRRRPRHQAGAGRCRGPQAHRRRVRLLRDPAGGRGQRDHPQLDYPGHDGVHRIPGPVGAFQAGTARDRRRRNRPLGNAGHVLSAHRARGHRAERRARSRRTTGW